MSQTVLITGVTGFLGRYIARHFAGAGWHVVGLGTQPAENAPQQLLAHYQTLRLPSPTLDEIVRDFAPTLCVHCAGRASIALSMSDPQADFEASVQVTFNVLDSLRRHAPACHLIYLSSAAVYGNPPTLPIDERAPTAPLSPYGYHKLLGEQLCEAFWRIYQLPTTSVRIFSAYGPGLRRQVMWDLCQKALTQPRLTLQGSGEESRDFIHGRDVARAIYHLAQAAPGQGERYNLASGQETTIRVLAERLCAALGREIPIEFDGVIPPGTPRNWRADIGRLSATGWEPAIPLAEGVEVFAHWCRAEIVG